ncbi:MAG: DUF423 domain-containing protein [Gemmatimonadota bacterium]
MDRTFAVLGSLFALLAVAAGAFGAHALRARLSPQDLAIVETAARYQMYHALGLLAVAWVASRAPSGTASAAGWLFVAGIATFSGSLYLLTLTGARWLGAITPIGGLSFMVGWLCLALAARSLPSTP